MRKKLIEVALPRDEINRAAAKEKSIRHGHPSAPAPAMGARALHRHGCGGVPIPKPK